VLLREAIGTAICEVDAHRKQTPKKNESAPMLVTKKSVPKMTLKIAGGSVAS
jgi:hypothetical protein